jgi:hypothetical protein
MDSSVKEVVMEVGAGGYVEPADEEEYEQEAGGVQQKTRRRRRRAPGMSRRGRRAAAMDVSGGGSDVAVHKESAGNQQPSTISIPTTSNPPVVSNTSIPVKPAVSAVPSIARALGAKPTIIIAPPKKKPAKVMLVPKKIGSPLSVRPQKTFKAKRVRVMIDNTAKTQKRRRLTLQEVDAMSEDDLRLEAVRARLSKPETVAKVPVDLLRQMLKDYRMMRGMLL